MTEKTQRHDNRGFRLPEDLAKEMDKLIGTHGFTSRAEIAKQAIREYLDSHKPLEPKLQRFEHFNIDNDGVRILDRALATTTCQKGRIVDVYFRPKGAFCEYDQKNDCEHVEFALSLSEVREILKKKGWKLPDVS